MQTSSGNTRRAAPVSYWSSRFAGYLLLIVAIGVLYLGAPPSDSPLSVWLPTLRHAAADLLGALIAFKCGSLLKRGEWRAVPPRVRRKDMRDVTILSLLFASVAPPWPYALIGSALLGLFLNLWAMLQIRSDEKTAEFDRALELLKASRLSSKSPKGPIDCF